MRPARLRARFKISLVVIQFLESGTNQSTGVTSGMSRQLVQVSRPESAAAASSNIGQRAHTAVLGDLHALPATSILACRILWRGLVLESIGLNAAVSLVHSLPFRQVAGFADVHTPVLRSITESVDPRF